MHIQKRKIPKINNLSFNLRKLVTEEQIKFKENSIKQILKIRAETNEIKNKKSIEKINKPQSWFFEISTNIKQLDINLTKYVSDLYEKNYETLINQKQNKW